MPLALSSTQERLGLPARAVSRRLLALPDSPWPAWRAPRRAGQRAHPYTPTGPSAARHRAEAAFFQPRPLGSYAGRARLSSRAQHVRQGLEIRVPDTQRRFSLEPAESICGSLRHVRFPAPAQFPCEIRKTCDGERVRRLALAVRDSPFRLRPPLGACFPPAVSMAPDAQAPPSARRRGKGTYNTLQKHALSPLHAMKSVQPTPLRQYGTFMACKLRYGTRHGRRTVL